MSVQRGRSRGWCAALGVASIAVAFATNAQTERERRSDYAALAALPDWSGWWGISQAPSQAQGSHPPPLKAEAAAAANAAANDLDPLRYCRPLQFTGYSGGFTEAIEWLFTPGRVTLTNERGLIRRIYTGGQPIPADYDATNTGLSVGHWDAQTLVVETTHIDPHALMGRVAIGENARITERIFLKDAETLEIDAVVDAPDVLREPYRTTQLYKHVPKTIANEITFCSAHDRSIDQSGRERFDFTPPPDLPPPPPH